MTLHKWQAVLDEHTLDACRLAHGKSRHPSVHKDDASMCRCVMYLSGRADSSVRSSKTFVTWINDAKRD